MIHGFDDSTKEKVPFIIIEVDHNNVSPESDARSFVNASDYGIDDLSKYTVVSLMVKRERSTADIWEVKTYLTDDTSFPVEPYVQLDLYDNRIYYGIYNPSVATNMSVRIVLMRIA